jgi:hypothetical protein
MNIIVTAFGTISSLLIFTLYLAPTKFTYSDAIAAVSLCILVIVLGVRKSQIYSGFRPLLPLFAALLGVIVLSLNSAGNATELEFYVKEFCIGFVPFFLLYIVFRNIPPVNQAGIVVLIFLAPGVVHIAYMYWDIYMQFQKGNLFFYSEGFGLLERVKEAPRVGRRYLSMAVLHLLCAGILIAASFRGLFARFLGFAVASVSMLSLTLLDARAAYSSVIVGGGLVFLASGPRQVLLFANKLRKTSRAWKLSVTLVLGALVFIGFSAGQSRWMAMTYSSRMAIHDVFYSTEPLSRRPFVDGNYWSAPVDDMETCFQTQQFRCRVDQSAYLRLAWMLSGFQSLLHHPFGMGYSNNYLGRFWGVEGEAGKYQIADSFLVEQLVCFGFVSCLFYSVLIWNIVRQMPSIFSEDPAYHIVIVGVMILVCFGRALVDQFNEGQWRYLTALLGAYFGMLHSRGRCVNV